MLYNHSRRNVLAAVLLTAWPAVLLAADDEDREADHNALRHLRAVFEEAVNRNELDLLKPYLDEHFTVVTYTDLEFSDFDVFKVAWQKRRDELLAGGSYSVVLEPELSDLRGDIAIARGNAKNVLVNGSGDEYHFSSHWTAVCRKVDGEWKILRAHSSLDPFGNPMLVSHVRSHIHKLLAGVSAACLIIGCGIGLVWARLRRSRGTKVGT